MMRDIRTYVKLLNPALPHLEAKYKNYRPPVSQNVVLRPTSAYITMASRPRRAKRQESNMKYDPPLAKYKVERTKTQQ